MSGRVTGGAIPRPPRMLREGVRQERSAAPEPGAALGAAVLAALWAAGLLAPAAVAGTAAWLAGAGSRGCVLLALLGLVGTMAALGRVARGRGAWSLGL